MDAHSPAQLRSPGAEPCRDLVERARLPRVPALPRELDGGRTTLNAVARAIEDLQRSGYRPLHTCRGAPELSSIPRARVAQGATCETEKRKSSGAYPRGGGHHDARDGGDVGARRAAGGLAG
jgi:hypothetical protein